MENRENSDSIKNLKEIGDILSRARHDKGITLEKVHKVTRIQPRIIEAFEKGVADQILNNKVYSILFLRKYASFLGLNADELAARYKASYKDDESKKLDLTDHLPEKELDFRKWVAAAVFLLLAFISIHLTFVLGSKLIALFHNMSVKKTASAKAKKIDVKKEDKSDPQRFYIPKDKPIILSLRSTNDVWMKVKKDGRTVFEGTLSKGASKEWLADDHVDLWAGRAEALEIEINGFPTGKIGEGNIKNIRISRQGLKINNKWLLEAKD
ncbi:MAG: DUF4115 domain-containing protein [Candidatus Omnitrophica bacterium]|nr:DUF4115 domain-containing protein [Candidatus Omnitrophota bacterium]